MNANDLLAWPAVQFDRLSNHTPGRVALLFSGGKNSRALIELFRPYLAVIMVYHNDTGDLSAEIALLGDCCGRRSRPACSLQAPIAINLWAARRASVWPLYWLL